MREPFLSLPMAVGFALYALTFSLSQVKGDALVSTSSSTKQSCNTP